MAFKCQPPSVTDQYHRSIPEGLHLRNALVAVINSMRPPLADSSFSPAPATEGFREEAWLVELVRKTGCRDSALRLTLSASPRPDPLHRTEGERGQTR